MFGALECNYVNWCRPEMYDTFLACKSKCWKSFESMKMNPIGRLHFLWNFFINFRFGISFLFFFVCLNLFSNFCNEWNSSVCDSMTVSHPHQTPDEQGIWQLNSYAATATVIIVHRKGANEKLEIGYIIEAHVHHGPHIIMTGHTWKNCNSVWKINHIFQHFR